MAKNAQEGHYEVSCPFCDYETVVFSYDPSPLCPGCFGDVRPPASPVLREAVKMDGRTLHPVRRLLRALQESLERWYDRAFSSEDLAVYAGPEVYRAIQRGFNEWEFGVTWDSANETKTTHLDGIPIIRDAAASARRLTLQATAPTAPANRGPYPVEVVYLPEEWLPLFAGDV